MVTNRAESCCTHENDNSRKGPWKPEPEKDVHGKANHFCALNEGYRTSVVAMTFPNYLMNRFQRRKFLWYCFRRIVITNKWHESQYKRFLVFLVNKVSFRLLSEDKTCFFISVVFARNNFQLHASFNLEL